MKIGDKIVCVDNSISPEKLVEINQDFPNWIIQDTVYTVRNILDNDDIVTGILVDEITNPLKYFKLIGKIQEPAFAMWRFRKLETTSIEYAEEELEEIYNLNK